MRLPCFVFLFPSPCVFYDLPSFPVFWPFYHTKPHTPGRWQLPRSTTDYHRSVSWAFTDALDGVRFAELRYQRASFLSQTSFTSTYKREGRFVGVMVQIPNYKIRKGKKYLSRAPRGAPRLRRYKEILKASRSVGPLLTRRPLHSAFCVFVRPQRAAWSKVSK